MIFSFGKSGAPIDAGGLRDLNPRSRSQSVKQLRQELNALRITKSQAVLVFNGDSHSFKGQN
jgi:hypothetical protein